MTPTPNPTTPEAPANAGAYDFNEDQMTDGWKVLIEAMAAAIKEDRDALAAFHNSVTRRQK